MAINKIIYGSSTLIDLTGDDVTAADVASGKIFHLSSGVQAVGTASGTASIDVANYSILPATGSQNQIALINDTAINDVYIQPEEPDAPAEGDVWIKTGWAGNVYLQFDIAKVYLTTCRQYVSSAWVIIPEWYVYTTAWTRARLYLIQDGTVTGAQSISTRRWRVSGMDGLGGTSSGSVLSFTQGSSYATLSFRGSTSTNGTYGAGGICTPNFNAGQYSKACIDLYLNDQPGYLVVNESDDTYAYTTTIAYSQVAAAARRVFELEISQTDTPCSVFFGVQATRYNGWTTATCRIYNLYLE